MDREPELKKAATRLQLGQYSSPEDVFPLAFMAA
jgi:hypothetical protein